MKNMRIDTTNPKIVITDLDLNDKTDPKSKEITTEDSGGLLTSSVIEDSKKEMDIASLSKPKTIDAKKIITGDMAENPQIDNAIIPDSTAVKPKFRRTLTDAALVASGYSSIISAQQPHVTDASKIILGNNKTDSQKDDEIKHDYSQYTPTDISISGKKLRTPQKTTNDEPIPPANNPLENPLNHFANKQDNPVDYQNNAIDKKSDINPAEHIKNKKLDKKSKVKDNSETSDEEPKMSITVPVTDEINHENGKNIEISLEEDEYGNLHAVKPEILGFGARNEFIRQQNEKYLKEHPEPKFSDNDNDKSKESDEHIKWRSGYKNHQAKTNKIIEQYYNAYREAQLQAEEMNK